MTTRIKKSDPGQVSGYSERRRLIVEALGWQVHVHSHVWSPPTDFYETEDSYQVRVEVAGMRQEDFNVQLNKNILVITGFRPDLTEKRAFLQMEIRSGEFKTAVELPEPVDIDNANAEYDDGFLIIKLPKASTGKIQIKD